MINKFSGDYAWLSNFWPCQVNHEGMVWSSVEHAYQAAKTQVRHEKLRIQKMTSGQAKRHGRIIKVRPDWLHVRRQIMKTLVFQKFEHPDLKKLLIATGTQWIEEGNTWGDTYWGVFEGQGQNQLGHIIMECRDRLVHG